MANKKTRKPYRQKDLSRKTTKHNMESNQTEYAFFCCHCLSIGRTEAKKKHWKRAKMFRSIVSDEESASSPMPRSASILWSVWILALFSTTNTHNSLLYLQINWTEQFLYILPNTSGKRLKWAAIVQIDVHHWIAVKCFYHSDCIHRKSDR